MSGAIERKILPVNFADKVGEDNDIMIFLWKQVSSVYAVLGATI